MASYGVFYEPQKVGGFIDMERTIYGPLSAFSKAWAGYDLNEERSVYGAGAGIRWKF